MRNVAAQLVVRILSTNCWNEFGQLLGPRGAYVQWWCTPWKLPNSESNSGSPEEMKAAQKAMVCSEGVPGLRLRAAMSWLGVEPRQIYPRLALRRTASAHVHIRGGRIRSGELAFAYRAAELVGAAQ